VRERNELRRISGNISKYPTYTILYLPLTGVCLACQNIGFCTLFVNVPGPGINAWAYVCKDVIATSGIPITTAKPIYIIIKEYNFESHMNFKKMFLLHLSAACQTLDIFTATQPNDNTKSQGRVDDYNVIIHLSVFMVYILIILKKKLNILENISFSFLNNNIHF